MQAKYVSNYVGEPGSSQQHEPDDETSLSTSRTRLCNKLRAIEVEIDAVASSIDRIKSVADDGNDACDKNGDGGDKVEESAVNDVQCSNGLSLEQAFVSDRLRSLKKAKTQLEKEISSFGDCAFDDIEHKKQTDKLLGELVRENQTKKKSIELSTRPSKRSLKAVSYDEDVDFDAVLDASSSGFMETVRVASFF